MSKYEDAEKEMNEDKQEDQIKQKGIHIKEIGNRCKKKSLCKI